MATYEINNVPAPIDWECNDDLLRRTLQNAKNLLMLSMGECPYDRLRGFDRALYYLPANEMQQKVLPEVTRAMLWEPDVQVLSASVQPLDGGEYLVSAQVEISFEEGGE